MGEHCNEGDHDDSDAKHSADELNGKGLFDDMQIPIGSDEEEMERLLDEKFAEIENGGDISDWDDGEEDEGELFGIKQCGKRKLEDTECDSPPLKKQKKND